MLPESCAILRYLCNSRRTVPDHWCGCTALPARAARARAATPARVLPQQRRVARLRRAPDARLPANRYPVAPRQRARVDAALDWHHATLRRGAAALVFQRLFAGNGADVATDPVRMSRAVDHKLRRADLRADLSCPTGAERKRCHLARSAAPARGVLVGPARRRCSGRAGLRGWRCSGTTPFNCGPGFGGRDRAAALATERRGRSTAGRMAARGRMAERGRSRYRAPLESMQRGGARSRCRAARAASQTVTARAAEPCHATRAATGHCMPMCLLTVLVRYA